MTELRYEIADLLAQEIDLSWAEALSLSSRVLKLVAKPEVFPEHKFAKDSQQLWPGIRQGEISTLRLLLSKEIVRHQEILYATDSKSESLDIVKVWVSHLRHRTGAKIKSIYRIGYSMAPEDQKRLTQEIGNLS